MLITTEVIVRWNPTTKNHYIQLGYEYTKINNEFSVPIEHLMTSSNMMIEVNCDYCGDAITKSFSDRNQKLKKSLLKKDCCKKCVPLRNKEELIYKSLNGLSSEDDHGYWTIKENRIKSLKDYLSIFGDLATILDNERGKRLYDNFSNHGDNVVECAVYDLGYSYDELNFGNKGIYNNVDLIIPKVRQFIDIYKRFPRSEEFEDELGIDTRYVNRLGGIYELKRIMDYRDTNDLVDDNGWFNKSTLEYTVAQYLINHTNFYYKREQTPFPERRFRSDFTLYFENNSPIHVEVWGYEEENKSDRCVRYNGFKKVKMGLYEKYAVQLISLNKTEIFNSRSISNITKKLDKVFAPYKSLIPSAS